MNRFYGEAGSATSTCIGVQALLTEGAMVEIDVTALTPSLVNGVVYLEEDNHP